jgi:hypothetical protein
MEGSPTMKKLLKEPLIHFLVLGGLLFLLYGFVAPDGNPDGNDNRVKGEIVITDGLVNGLTQKFTKTWQRPPTEQELESLLDEHIKEEVMYREALAMGLDRDDTIIRRRLRQKLEFISEDLFTAADPTAQELEDYLKAHRDSFRNDSRFTYRQVFLDPKKHGDKIDSQVDSLLATLRVAGPALETSGLGDSLMLEHLYEDSSHREVASLFGQEFAQSLESLEPGTWQGPIKSGYGVHLVLITKKTDGGQPKLGEVKDLVTREWRHAKRQEANELFYQALLDQYTVTRVSPK